MPIDAFRGEYRFLSNFFEAEVTLDGLPYRTVEHAFQAAKTDDEAARKKIRKEARAGEAKRLGRRVKLRPDWESAKVDVMLGLLRQKFARPQLRDLLLATGEQELVEGNDWNDTFWGVCDGRGHNHLGRLLMKVRAELKENEVTEETDCF